MPVPSFPLDTVSFEIDSRACGRQRIWIDRDDLFRVAGLTWGLHRVPGSNTLYVRAHLGGRGGGQVYLHRFILDPPNGLEVDHVSRDALDNRRSNLRICEFRAQNRWNIGFRKANTSGFMGVSFSKITGRWAAKFRHQGRSVHLGLFETAEEAATARNTAVAKLRGEFVGRL
jgi:hypothetical protein